MNMKRSTSIGAVLSAACGRKGFEYELIGDDKIVITDVTHSTASVIPGALFVCITGENVDGHELAQLDVAQECGRTAAQMQLTDRLAHAHGCCVERYFTRQVVQIRCGPIMVLGNDFVASAVVAQRFTKRNVHVNGQGPVFWADALLAKFQSLSQIAL